MNRKLIAPFLCFLLIIGITGCSSNTTNPTQSNGPTGASLVSAILKAVPTLTSFQYSETLTTIADYPGESFTTTLTTTGRQDNTAQESYSTNTADQTSSAQFQFEIYVLNGWSYTRYAPTSKVPTGLTLGIWYKAQMDATMLTSTFSNIDAILFKSATLATNGNEILNGITCWKTTVVPNKTQLAIFLVDKGEIDATADLGNLNQSLSNISMLAWVDQDSNIVVRETLALTMVVNGESFKVTDDESVSNIDQPVTIDLPADAANALQTN